MTCGDVNSCRAQPPVGRAQRATPPGAGLPVGYRHPTQEHLFWGNGFSSIVLDRAPTPVALSDLDALSNAGQTNPVPSQIPSHPIPQKSKPFPRPVGCYRAIQGQDIPWLSPLDIFHILACLAVPFLQLLGLDAYFSSSRLILFPIPSRSPFQLGVLAHAR